VKVYRIYLGINGIAHPKI